MAAINGSPRPIGDTDVLALGQVHEVEGGVVIGDGESRLCDLSVEPVDAVVTDEAEDAQDGDDTIEDEDEDLALEDEVVADDDYEDDESDDDEDGA